ncbi:MAG: site-specific integrase [Campylobacterales bacterium]|nr:site-specific integrase [Campylobacterales bacterium]
MGKINRIKTKYNGVFYRETVINGKPDKTYYIRYSDTGNKKVELKVGKYSEGIRELYCHNKRNEIITKIRLGETVQFGLPKKEFTPISELAEEYFKYRIMHSPKSGAHELRRYNNHLKSVFGSLSVEEITHELLLQFQTKKSQTHAKKTVNILIDMLSTIISHAIKNEKINTKNPLQKLKRFDIDNERERYLTEEEAQKLLKDTREDNHELYTFCLLALTTGGRLETILSLREADCDFVNRTANLKDFKNNSTYKTFLIDKAITAIKKQLVENNGVVFKICLSEIQRRVSAHLEQFNKNINPNDRKNRVVIHTLRHTFASRLAIKGTPIFTIQKLMNHADIKMTMRYAKLSPDSGRDFVENIF